MKVFTNIPFHRSIIASVLTFSLLAYGLYDYAGTTEANIFGLFHSKKKKAGPPPASPYKRLTGRDSVAMGGVMNVIQTSREVSGASVSGQQQASACPERA